MQKNKIAIWTIAVIILIVLMGIIYYSIPHLRPVPINDILKNNDRYKGNDVMVEGEPVLLSSVTTRYGKYSFFAIKDATGQIPVSRDISESYMGTKISIVGTVGYTCTLGIANETSGTWICDKMAIGIVT